MPEKKRILILTADAGFGHRNAANAIGAALQERHGDECETEIINPLDDEHTPSFLQGSQAEYDRAVRNSPEIYRLRYEASDTPVPAAIMENAFTVMLYTTMHKLIKRYQPNAIISTYPFYQAPLGAVFAVRNIYIPLLMVITDLIDVHRVWFNDAVDLYMVPTEAVYQQGIENGRPADQLIVTGIPVKPAIVKETREPAAIRAELGWRPDLCTVLAVGSTRVEHLRDVLRPLNHSGLPIQLAVVAGGDDAVYRELQNTEWHAVTHPYNYVDNLPQMMRASDCIVTKAGGLIVTESLACGLPMLLIDVLPGQEMGNATYVVGGSAGVRVTEPLEALETLYHWLDRDRTLLAQYAENARRLGRPQAAYEVAEHAWEAAQRGPQTRSLREILGVPTLTDLLDRYGIPVEGDNE